jgi:hypothetical protein
MDFLCARRNFVDVLCVKPRELRKRQSSRGYPCLWTGFLLTTARPAERASTTRNKLEGAGHSFSYNARGVAWNS